MWMFQPLPLPPLDSQGKNVNIPVAVTSFVIFSLVLNADVT